MTGRIGTSEILAPQRALQRPGDNIYPVMEGDCPADDDSEEFFVLWQLNLHGLIRWTTEARLF